MSREEAIKTIKIFNDYHGYKCREDLKEALQMAISALEQQPCEDAEQIDYHDDFATALKKMQDYEEQQNDKKCGSYNNTNTFKSCGNCKLIGTESCYMTCGGSKSLYKPKQKPEPCENQSNACSILDDECPYPHKHCWECSLNYQYELAKHELDKNVELPSVTQKSGKWIKNELNEKA